VAARETGGAGIPVFLTRRRSWPVGIASAGSPALLRALYVTDYGGQFRDVWIPGRVNGAVASSRQPCGRPARFCSASCRQRAYERQQLAKLKQAEADAINARSSCC
jgi:hypothetical protein